MIASLSVTNSLQTGFDRFFGYIPNIIGFLVILLIGYIVARILKTIVNTVLGKLKIDETLQKSAAGSFVDKLTPGGRPSRFVGGVVFWLVFIYALTAAIGALKIPSVTAFMNRVLDYLPNVVAAVIIFVIAAAVAGIFAAAAKRTMGDTPTGKLAETVIPGLVMAIAIFMILNQLKIAAAIVTITYAALLGMLALTGALAFGLGGRDVAGRMWSQAYEQSRAVKERASRDLETGQSRAREQTQGASSTRPFASRPPAPPTST